MCHGRQCQCHVNMGEIVTTSPEVPCPHKSGGHWRDGRVCMDGRAASRRGRQRPEATQTSSCVGSGQGPGQLDGDIAP